MPRLLDMSLYVVFTSQNGKGGRMGALSIVEFGYRNLQKAYHMTFVNNNELRTLHMSYENACNNFINLSYGK
jgi:hypothetical protein